MKRKQNNNERNANKQFKNAIRNWTNELNKWYSIGATHVQTRDAFDTLVNRENKNGATDYESMLKHACNGQWVKSLDTYDREEMCLLIEKQQNKNGKNKNGKNKNGKNKTINNVDIEKTSIDVSIQTDCLLLSGLSSQMFFASFGKHTTASIASAIIATHVAKKHWPKTNDDMFFVVGQHFNDGGVYVKMENAENEQRIVVNVWDDTRPGNERDELNQIDWCGTIVDRDELTCMKQTCKMFRAWDKHTNKL